MTYTLYALRIIEDGKEKISLYEKLNDARLTVSDIITSYINPDRGLKPRGDEKVTIQLTSRAYSTGDQYEETETDTYTIGNKYQWILVSLLRDMQREYDNHRFPQWAHDELINQLVCKVVGAGLEIRVRYERLMLMPVYWQSEVPRERDGKAIFVDMVKLDSPFAGALKYHLLPNAI